MERKKRLKRAVGSSGVQWAVEERKKKETRLQLTGEEERKERKIGGGGEERQDAAGGRRKNFLFSLSSIDLPSSSHFNLSLGPQSPGLS